MSQNVRDYRVELLVSAVLALVTFLVYSRTFDCPFVNYDDPDYVSQNAQVQAGLTAGGLEWAFTTFACGNWHPLTWLSLEFDCTLYGGPEAGGFHLTNVLLHTVNTLLLFVVLGRMTGLVWRSAVVAGLFALHPLHVESVAWVAERKDVLSTLFWMLALAAYLHYVRRPGLGRYSLVVVALALGLMAKPMLATLPCVLLLLDYWPLRRWSPSPSAEEVREQPLPEPASWRWLVMEKVPLFVLIVASCLVTFVAQRRGQAVAPLAAVSLAARVGNALVAYAAYTGKMLWPAHLAVYYPHPGSALPLAEVLGAALLLALVTVLMLGPGRRWPYLAVGWLWYLGTLVPVIGLVQVGGQSMADRYTYVPLIGLFLGLTWGVADVGLAWRVPRGYLVGGAAALLAVCALLTWVQQGYWTSNLDLWEHTAAVTEGNVLAHVNLGDCYQEQGRLSDARKEFEKAVAIDPNVPEPHVNLGNVLSDLGRKEQAESEFRKAIDLAPHLALPHNNLATVLTELGRPREAVAEFRKAIDLDPERAWSHTNLGNVLRSLGQLDEAMAEFRRGAELDPGDAQPHNNLGIVYAELGRREEAAGELSRAIALDPNAGPAHTNLGRVLQDEDRLEEATAEYRTALELGDKQARSLLQGCERLRALRPRLPGLVAGRDRPRDNAERLAFADLCRQPFEARYSLAARLYTEAFDADPSLAEDVGAARRFHAASAAAGAGCAQGQDGAALDPQERAQMRCQAREWLLADLALWTKQAAGDSPQAQTAVQEALRTWQRDPGLAGVREQAQLANLTAPEREAWQQLWQQVEAALAQTDAQRKMPPSLTPGPR
jgi:tetratricopeptide (TPR) repeat protein